MKKKKLIYFNILILLIIGFVMSCWGASAKADEVKYTIRLAAPGMTPEEVIKAVGQPTFKAKKNQSWHYRKKPNAPVNLSDPQITFKDNCAYVIIGGQLEANAVTILSRGDRENKISEVLGKADKIETGEMPKVKIYYYHKLALQIVTHNGQVMVMRFN
ncbi:MAG: hypothetical protein ACI376_00720 [Candidatus Bruticola sp.]